MDKFVIADYLTKIVGEEKGFCKSCEKIVPWSRGRVTSHKSANCPAISEQEKAFFRSQNNQKVIRTVSVASSLIDDSSAASEVTQTSKRQKVLSGFLDTISVGQRDAASQAFAKLFFRTGIPFRVADSLAMKDFVKKLRPAYVDLLPSAEVIGGTFLNKEYDDLFERGKSFLAGALYYSLVSDGWSNLRNEHMVNFVIIVPGHKPFFFKSVSTVGIRQTSQAIAKEIMDVINLLGEAKCVSVVTDNASNMRGAWDIIEDKYPHIFANGCGAHVMNLLIKDICEIERYQDTLSEVQFLVRFVKDHHHVLAKFNELRRQYNISKTLCLTVPTRWYTHFNSCETLNKAKYAMTQLLEEGVLDEISGRAQVERFRKIIGDMNFWIRLKEIIKVLSLPTSIIGKFESDKSDLFTVYDYFMRLSGHWATIDGLDPAHVDRLNDIVSARWAFIHTSSMGFAYMLTPSCAKKPWAATDKLSTKKELKKYIDVFFHGNEESILKCKDEVESFLTLMGDLSADLEEEFFAMTGRQYWSQYGKQEFPYLAQIACRMYAVPTSSAAAERVWSIYAFIHTKKRNRLSMEKVEKLAFIYINHSLLDDMDDKDYIGEGDVDNGEI